MILSEMTANKRICLNIIATYGRSVYSMVCGVFTSRWVLMALGDVDYGLYGVVGGFAAIISFVNLLLATAVGRFYAVSVGAAQVAGDVDSAIEECRKWFSVAVMIHTIVPVILVVIGYPLGMWAIERYLVIPPDRIQACIWVFRFVCITCFVAMVNVPFTAMYTAKQEIAELTLYSFATSTFNILFVYYMVTHPSDWLASYGLWMCLMVVIPQMIIKVRAMIIFRECKFRFCYCRELMRVKQLCSYAGWQAFGCLGGMLRVQGMSILVNKMFGPAINASMAVANTVNNHAQTLASALVGAFTPAIANSFGADQMKRVHAMAYRSCKFGLALSLIFMIPLMIEIREIINIWLKNPPPFVPELCVLAMIVYLIDQAAVGHRVAVDSSGKIAVYELVLGSLLIATLPLAWWFVYLGGDVFAVMAAMIIVGILVTLGRVYFGKAILGMSYRIWVFEVILPVCLVTVITLTVGLIPHLVMEASFVRIIVTTMTCEMVFVPLLWFKILSSEERAVVVAKLKGRFAK